MNAIRLLWTDVRWRIATGLIATGPMAAGAAPQLIADVNKQPEVIGANPSEMVAVGGRVFFTSQDRVHGGELWVTDGTEAGTRLVKDIKVGQGNSLPFMLRAVGARLFFFADDGVHGIKLWSSDGENTAMAGGPEAGNSGIYAGAAAAAGNLHYFTDRTVAYDYFYGWGLWRSDGTAGGTWLLNPGQRVGFGSNRPFGYSTSFTEMNGSLFFSSFDVFANSDGLWRSSGTLAETVKLADFGTGGQILSMAGANGRLWFTLARGNSTRELWSWHDGAAAMIVSFANNYSFGGKLTAQGGRVFLASNDPETGVELWTSDGTTTRRVADIFPGPGGSSPSDLTWCGDTLFFTANNGITGRGLWASDGVQTWPVKTWQDGVAPTNLVANGGVLFFVRNEGGEVLWRSDGTETGTRPIKQITAPGTGYGYTGLMSGGGTLYFEGNDGQARDELWSSDGTPNGTRMLRDLTGTADGFMGVDRVAAWGNKLAFCGNDGISGDEPWSSDGTVAGTRMLADVRPGPESSGAAHFATAGGKLYFSASDGVHGIEPWRSGTSGTKMVRDINPGSSFSYPNGFTVFGERMAFTTSDETEQALWITDGDNATKVKGSAGRAMGSIGGGLLFSARDAGLNDEPWWTDGTTTRLFKDLIPGSQGSDPGPLTRIGNEAYFQTYSNTAVQLWRTDGTESGTLQIDGWQGLWNSYIYPMVAVRDRLFFFEGKTVSGLKLWIAQNGQVTFVRQIGEPLPDYQFSQPAYLEVCGGLLFFVANDGVHGAELWRSDGTAAGTVMVRDIRPGPMGSALTNLKAVGGRVFFQANDGVHGEELWSTDGTTAGTGLEADMVPGSGGSAPRALVVAGNRLFFSAVTQETGCEPYLLDVGPILDFHAWTEAASLDGLDAAPLAAPHGDGVANLLKYAFEIEGASPYQGVSDGEPGHLPRISVITDGGGTTLQVAYARRTGSSLIYTAKRSATLEDESFVPMAGEEVITTGIDGWERVVRSEQVDGERCFGVVEVTMPQSSTLNMDVRGVMTQV